MNQTIALILTIVVTNWTEIGEVRDKSNRLFSLQEGQIATNTVARVHWSEFKTNSMVYQDGTVNDFITEYFKTNEFVLKSIPGTVIMERKAILITNIWVTNIGVPHIPWITNLNPHIIYNSNVELTNKP